MTCSSIHFIQGRFREGSGKAHDLLEHPLHPDLAHLADAVEEDLSEKCPPS
jgi:hypothetical protein